MAHRLVLSLGGVFLVGVAHGSSIAAQASSALGAVTVSAVQTPAAEPVSSRVDAVATRESTGPTVAALSAAVRAPVVTKGGDAMAPQPFIWLTDCR
jgi:hypothetical protein